MPLYMQRDIFDTITNRRALAVVFGRLGFNEMRIAWEAYRLTIPALVSIEDPFTENLQIQIEHHKWLWFIAASEDGMEDGQFIDNLNKAVNWAQNNNIRYLITNGIADIGHGTNKELNRLNDDRRTRLLIAYAANKEHETGIGIELTSLNDVFIRNRHLVS